MILSRTPFRVSLFGGGTDYPSWYHDHGGAVIGMAINKYCYISLRKLPSFFDHRHRVVYSKIENVKNVAQIEHPSVRAVLSEHPPACGLEIHHDGELPARSGLASSSAFTVGLLKAWFCAQGREPSPGELCAEATRIEQQVIGENVGSQDQAWASYGGFNTIRFHQDGALTVSPVVLPAARQKALIGSLMLFFTGISRYASVIAGEKIANFKNRTAHLHALGGMVEEARDIFEAPTADLRQVGALLHESWILKRELADGVTNPKIDAIYQAGIDAGALGGKVLGAGGGGFVLFYVEQHNQEKVRQRLRHLTEVQFDIDLNGSTVIVNQPDGPEAGVA